MQWDGVKSALLAYSGFAPDVAKTNTVAERPSRAGDEPEQTAPPDLSDWLLAVWAVCSELVQPALGTDDVRFFGARQAVDSGFAQPGQ